jgi:DNA-binding MarR family transcriptional regulator
MLPSERPIAESPTFACLCPLANNRGHASLNQRPLEPARWIAAAQAELEFGQIKYARPSAAELLAFARALYVARQQRSRFLNPDLLGEPGWDMLLALFVAGGEQRPLTVSDLAGASGVPPTTAYRWIQTLHEQKLTARKRNPFDARVIFVELEPEGRKQMIAYLENAWQRLQSDLTKSE